MSTHGLPRPASPGMANTILYGDLTGIVLLGLSYGGMVVTGTLPPDGVDVGPNWQQVARIIFDSDREI